MEVNEWFIGDGPAGVKIGLKVYRTDALLTLPNRSSKMHVFFQSDTFLIIPSA